MDHIHEQDDSILQQEEPTPACQEPEAAPEAQAGACEPAPVPQEAAPQHAEPAPQPAYSPYGSPAQPCPPQQPYGYYQQPYQPQAYGYAPQQMPPSAYNGAGTGRKESPYAHSPYVMQQPQQGYRYQPQPPQKPVKEKKERKPGAGRRVAAVLLVLVLLVGSCSATALAVNAYWESMNALTVSTLTEQIADLQEQIDALPEPVTTPSVGTRPASGSGMTPSQLYASNVDSVVAISSTIQSTSYYGTTEGTSSGSGFILTADGYVITNHHVVEGATSVEVILHDGTTYPAQIVGSDSTNDIAVLKVEGEGLKPAAIGSSSALNIGDMVVAIGNPLGELASTQTVGYVSGINRDVTTDSTIISMIQTDAAINPGNSGGPLFNMAGEVIGITTAKYSGTTSSGASIEGIGFAIPIDDVTGIISDLIQYGYVTGAYLGVTVQNTDAAAASLFGLPTGAYVVSVVKGASAHRAGIQPKDIIIALGGHEVNGITGLTRALRNFKAGDTTTVTLIRGGEKLTLDIELDEKPPVMPEPDTDTPATEPSYNGWEDWFDDFAGN